MLRSFEEMGRSRLFTSLEMLLFSTTIIFICLNEFRSESAMQLSSRQYQAVGNTFWVASE